MKAIILAAGKGERLKSVTEHMPKPMIVYKGKPILEHNIELCKHAGVTEVCINLHHLPEVITRAFGDGSRLGVKIIYSFEETLIGTAGAVKKIFREYWPEDAATNDQFLVVYGDNYTEFPIELLRKKAQEHQSSAVIGFHYREDTEHSGVAEFASDQRILKFVEKPKQGESDSHWVNAGIYLLKQDILEFIPEGDSDFSRDIFPALLANGVPMYGVCDERDVKAFDTIEMYNKSFGK